MVPASTLGEAAWAECESAIRRFEDAWRDGGRPDVASFLSAEAPHATQLLVELVHVDLEFRLRAGDFARSEDYLARFPVLREAALALDLAAAEFALRNRHCPPAWPEEFWLRFPELGAGLLNRLPSASATGWLAATRAAERPGAPLPGPPVIAGYEVQGELGRGGMGVVYKARDLLLHRTVAVKTFATVPRPESCARFAREAEAIARLDHPHIVPVYEVGEWRAPDGGPAVPYFVMKWYAGGNLDAAPSGPGTEVAAHARVVETIARAVHHAHQRGVLHRDLKPSNILLDGAGRPHVADFGLAGRVEPDAATLTGLIAGTPAYMAPEQARSPRQVSIAADVYGLGAILYHQLTGQAPFDGETPLATLERVASEPPPHPSSVNPAVPRDLDTVCMKCLEKDPQARYASAAELADDLERWRQGLPIAARPARAWELAWRQARRHPLASALALTTLATLVGAVAVLAESNARIRAKEKEAGIALGRECIIRGELEGTLRREQKSLCLERVSSAARLYSANQLAEAWALLDLCPEQHRGWEWRYLDAVRRKATVALTGHAAPVQQVAFLPDGRLASADAEGFVRIWDVAALKTVRTWRASEARINTLAAHPRNNWVAVADPSAVWVFDADTGQKVAKLAGADWVAFSPDGARAATADTNSVLQWVVPKADPGAAGANGRPGATWEQGRVLSGHQNRVITGVFTADSQQLITSSSDRTIRTWDLGKGLLTGTRNTPTPVTRLALTGGGKLLAEAHPGLILVTDLTTGETRDRLEYPTGDRPLVVGRPDGQVVAISGANGEVVVWDSVRPRKHHVFRGHAGRVAAVAFGPGDRLASCGGDQTVRLWDLESEQGLRTLAWVGDGHGGLAVSPDGALVVVGPRRVGESTDARARVLDAATGRELRRVHCWPDLAIQPHTGLLATGRAEGGASLWNPATGEELWRKPYSAPRDPPMVTAAGGHRMAFSPDGSTLARWDPRAGGVQLWGAGDGTPLGVIETKSLLVHGIGFSPDGARLAVAAHDGLALWEVRSRARVSWPEAAPGALAVAFSPDGAWLATAELDRTVRLRDAATGREVRRFVGTGLRVGVLCFSPDGGRLATGGADRTVRIWDVESGRELISLPGATGAVTGLAWDAKNDRVYALDSAVRVWGWK